MIRLLRTEVTIPTWALFMALLVVSAVTAYIYGQSTAEALAHKAIDAGIFG